jgi:hypothetical protein
MSDPLMAECPTDILTIMAIMSIIAICI